MAVYMPAGHRTRRIALFAVIALIIGLGIGYFVGHSSVTTVDDAVGESRDRASDALAALGRLPIEYGQALTESRGESRATLAASVRSAQQLLDDAYATAPWIGRADRSATNAAVVTVLDDIGQSVDAATFENDIADATEAIARLFGVEVAAVS